MPQRFLRPGITTSKLWNRLGWFEQTLYVRLITLVDDYGRYEADPELIRSHAFPFGDPEGQNITLTAIVSGLTTIVRKRMLILYENDGKQFLQVLKWKERVRSESKFPAPTREQLLSIDNKCMLPSPAPAPAPAPAPLASDIELMPVSEPAEAFIEVALENGEVAPLTPLSEFLDTWNKLSSLAKCLALSDARRRKLTVRLNDPFFKANWREAMARISSTAFLRGDNDRGWRASFDWFIQPDSVVKIMEGKYNGKSNTNNSKPNPRNAGVAGNLAEIAATTAAVVARRQAERIAERERKNAEPITNAVAT